MAIGGWSVNDYLEALTALWPGQLPFGQSLWLFVPTASDPANSRAWSLGQDGNIDHYRESAYHDGTGSWYAGSRDTSTNGAVPSIAIPRDVWFNWTGAWVSNILREGRISGGNLGTNNTSKSVNAPNSTFIGVTPDQSFTIPGTIGIASPSAWDLSGFSEAQRNAWAAECASGANPNDMNNDTGQPWEGRLVPGSYASLLDLTAGSLGSFAEVGSLTVFASHPPVDGEGGGTLPGPPSLIALAHSWDAVRMDATAGADTDEIRIYRDTSAPDPQTSPLVATLTPDGTAFDTGLDPSTIYLYLPVASNAEGGTEGSGEVESTWPDTAIETFQDQDDITIPYNVPSGEKATALKLKAGVAARSVAALGFTGGISVEVRDAGNVLIGSETFPSLSVVNGGSALSVPLSPQPVGPQTLQATFTASITE